MSASQASGAALDAAVDTNDNAPARTAPQQAYLDAVADDAEKAVEAVEATIEHLQESLAGRKTEAKRARTEAENGRN